MKILILFSAWVKNRNADGDSWLDYYMDIIDREFSSDHVFVSINNPSYVLDYSVFKSLKNVIGSSNVPENMIINSDASGYQNALRECRSIINNYDVVCFFHMKGASYDYNSAAEIRNELSNQIFDRSRIIDAFSENINAIVAIKGYLSPSQGAIIHCNALCREMGIDWPVIHYAATLTLYAVSSKVLLNVMNSIPDRVLYKNLQDVGENRYFFEGMFPSMLSAMGANPVFLCGTKKDEGLNKSISYDCAPAHNSSLVADEFRKLQINGLNYKQTATPYVFGARNLMNSISVIYDPS